MGGRTGEASMKYYLDGLKRNLAKMWDEFLIVCAGMWTQLKDFKRPDHYFVNLLVETLRLSPYFWGHIWALYLIYSLIVWIV